MTSAIIWQRALSNMELHRPAGNNAHVLMGKGIKLTAR